MNEIQEIKTAILKEDIIIEVFEKDFKLKTFNLLKFLRNRSTSH